MSEPSVATDELSLMLRTRAREIYGPLIAFVSLDELLATLYLRGVLDCKEYIDEQQATSQSEI